MAIHQMLRPARCPANHHVGSLARRLAGRAGCGGVPAAGAAQRSGRCNVVHAVRAGKGLGIGGPEGVCAGAAAAALPIQRERVEVLELHLPVLLILLNRGILED